MPTVFPPRIYIVDTFFLATHDDFASRVKATIAVNGAFGDLENSHGTCMTSIAAGSWTGVYKNADIVLVQAKFNQRDEALAVFPLDERGGAWVRPDNNHGRGPAVRCKATPKKVIMLVLTIKSGGT